MDSVVLYRKYRPQKFSEVRGQETIVSALQNAVRERSPNHSYLFSGGRGTGKTTLARIFAAELGCAPADIYEIDAASNRGIDEIRALREAVATLPFQSPYKVYIVDEAHMLTPQAWNAFLKTLEEPPEHVIFILATTELEKVPETIVSRCQAFRFDQPTMEDLKEFVVDIAKKEGVKLPGPSAELIALFGDGSYRDALSVLEKALGALGGATPEPDAIARIIGAPTHDSVNAVIRSLAAASPEEGLIALREAGERQIDMGVYLKLLLSKLRVILLLRYAAKLEKEFKEEFTPEDLAFLKELAEDKSKRVNSHTLLEFLAAARRIGWSAIPSLPIEIALIRAIGEGEPQK